MRALRTMQVVGMLLAVSLSLFMTVSRYEYPLHDRHFFGALKGSADLWMPFNGARAVLRGVNPYGPLDADLKDPAGWDQTYPAVMHALYIPLVLVSGGDHERASVIFFWLNLLSLGVMAWAGAALLGTLDRLRSTDRWARGLVLASALATNLSAAFCIDRSQSELVTGALVWAGLALFVRGRVATAVMLCVLASAMKGYAIPVGLGLLLAAPREARRRSVITAALVSLTLLAPVLPWVLDGLRASVEHTRMFWEQWYNHSFKNLGAQLWPGHADLVRRALVGLTALATLGCGVSFVQVARRDPARAGPPGVLFVTAALATMLGAPQTSAVYNLMLVLPGALTLLLGASGLVRRAAGRSRVTPGIFALAGATQLAVCLLLVYRVGALTVAAVGLASLPVLCAGLARSLAHEQERTQAPVTLAVSDVGLA